jgi:hypothetical protein
MNIRQLLKFLVLSEEIYKQSGIANTINLFT